MEQETTTEETTQSPPPPTGSRELTRSASDRILGGVASGIARRLDLPAWLIRVIFILMSFGGGLGVALYLAGWAFIRSEDEPDTISERFFSRTTSTGSWIGVALIFIAILVLLDNVSFLRGGVIWAVALLAVGLLLYSGDLPRLIRDSDGSDSKEGVQQMTTKTPVAGPPATEREADGAAGESTPPTPPTPPPVPTPPILPPPAPPREKSMLGRLTFGVMTIALGLLALLDNTTDLVEPVTRHYIALAMTILGIGLVVGAFAGRARWLALVGLLALPFLFSSPALEYDFQDWNAATTFATPATFDDLQSSYDHSIGELVIDLRELPWDGQEVEIEASLGIGELRILLPDNVMVVGRAEASIGHVEFEERQSSGLGPNLPFDSPGPDGVLHLDASLGIGEIDIDRYSADN